MGGTLIASVAVPAHGSIHFDVDLAAVLEGHQSYPRGLPPGRYLVELNSEAGSSSPLAIVVHEVGDAK